MSDSSRRGFLGAVLSGASLVAAACSKPEPAAVPPATGATVATGATGPTGTPAPTPTPIPMDMQVADHFCGSATTFDGAANKPLLALSLYGLVLGDKANSELLLPASKNALPSSHLHRARLYATATIASGAADGTEVRADNGNKLPYWNIEGYRLTWTVLDGADKPIAAQGKPLKTPSGPQHPWANLTNVRDVCAITGLPILPLAKRNNSALVAARVDLTDGAISAGPPLTAIGSYSEWKVKKANGTSFVSATTDNMTFLRELPPAAAKIQVTFTPLDTATAKAPVVFVLKGGLLAAVITHATTASSMSMNMTLDDTKAFALLLDKGDPKTFPVPTFFRGIRGESRPEYRSGLSGTDGHCDCAFCN